MLLLLCVALAHATLAPMLTRWPEQTTPQHWKQPTMRHRRDALTTFPGTLSLGSSCADRRGAIRYGSCTIAASGVPHQLRLLDVWSPREVNTNSSQCSAVRPRTR